METPYEDPVLAISYENCYLAEKARNEYWNGKDIGPEKLARIHETVTSHHKLLRNMSADRALNWHIISSIAKDRKEQKRLIQEHTLLDKKQ